MIQQDPLSILRDAIIHSKPIKVNQEERVLQFGAFKLSMDRATGRLEQESAWKQRAGGKYYTLGALWCFMKHNGEMNKEYLAETKAFRLEMVSNLDKNQIKKYCKAQIQDSSHIDQTVRQQQSDEIKKTVEETAEEESKLLMHRKAGGSGELEPQTAISLDEQKKRFDQDTAVWLTRHERPGTLDHMLFGKQKVDFKPLVALMYEIMGKQDRAQQITYEIQRKNPHYNPENNPFDVSKTISQEGQLNLLQQILEYRGQGGQAGRPIVIIPNEEGYGQLNVHNCVQWLKQGDFRDPCEFKDCSILDVEFPLKVERRIDSKKVVFEFWSNPQHFDKTAWKRVVAVICSGVSHEFRDWEQANNKLLLFNTCKWMNYTPDRGYFVTFKGIPPPESIKTHNVKLLVLQKSKKHMDQTIAQEFWHDLQQFIGKPRFKIETKKDRLL